MKIGSAITAIACIILSASACPAQNKFAIDTGECGGDIGARVATSKTAIRMSRNGELRAYGLVEYRHNAEDAKAKHCHVQYRLFVARRDGKFAEVQSVGWDTEDGEIAGLDLIGYSPDSTKLAADFWLAEGDGQTHRPVIYDVSTGKATYRPLDDLIQKGLGGCYQVEHFVGVTNGGEAIFTVPPDDEDADRCGDKGIWYFNLQSGQVKQVKKISGDRWK